MNGVQAAIAFPATAVLRITSDRPMKTTRNGQADDVILAAVTHLPRSGETQPIAALLPQVLARYGLTEESAAQEIGDGATIDLFA